MASESFDYETQNHYSIRVRSIDPAGKYCEVVFIILVNDIDETTGLPINYNSVFRAYPNPFNHSTTILFSNPAGKPFRLILTDLSGKVCRTVDGITTSEYVLKKDDLKSGLYFIELRGPKIYRGKIVIE